MDAVMAYLTPDWLVVYGLGLVGLLLILPAAVLRLVKLGFLGKMRYKPRGIAGLVFLLAGTGFYAAVLHFAWVPGLGGPAAAPTQQGTAASEVSQAPAQAQSQASAQQRPAAVRPNVQPPPVSKPDLPPQTRTMEGRTLDGAPQPMALTPYAPDEAAMTAQADANPALKVIADLKSRDPAGYVQQAWGFYRQGQVSKEVMAFLGWKYAKFRNNQLYSQIIAETMDQDVFLAELREIDPKSFEITYASLLARPFGAAIASAVVADIEQLARDNQWDRTWVTVQPNPQVTMTSGGEQTNVWGFEAVFTVAITLAFNQTITRQVAVQAEVEGDPAQNPTVRIGDIKVR